MGQQQAAWPSSESVEAGRPFPGAHVVAWEKNPRRQEQRAVNRALVRVECIPQKGEIGGYLCESGVNFMLVYEDELDGIRALVATDEQKRRLADAERSYAIALRAHAKAKHELNDSMTSAEQEKAISEAGKTIGVSPWTYYSRAINGVTGGGDSLESFQDPGFPPLLSMEVSDEKVKPPLNAHTYAIERDERLGAAVAKGVAAAMSALKKAG